jgi:protein TonB
LAQIEARVQADNARPRRRYLSPATRKIAYASYYEKVKLKIESTGTVFFPQQGSQRLYGTLTLEFDLNDKGHLIDAQLIKGSGNPALDQRALAILHKAQPFEVFPTELKKEADELNIISVFHFNKAGMLSEQE